MLEMFFLGSFFIRILYMGSFYVLVIVFQRSNRISFLGIQMILVPFLAHVPVTVYQIRQPAFVVTPASVSQPEISALPQGWPPYQLPPSSFPPKFVPLSSSNINLNCS